MAERTAADTERRINAMKTERIELNPKVMMGKPVIRGTRLTVEMIVRKLSEGAVTGLAYAVCR
jgi:uncharacterized protein (DUF433 family)